MKIGLTGAKGLVGTKIIKEIENCQDLELAYAYDRTNNNIDLLFSSSDVVIDFSSKDLLPLLLDNAMKFKKPLVIGTTGFSEHDFESMRIASHFVAIFYSANMSMGIALISKMLKSISAQLRDYDISISELHHRNKKDSPSGTSLMLKKILEENLAENNVQVSSIRAGLNFCEHDISFISDSEIIEIKHNIIDRSVFAKSTLKIAKWIQNQPNGFYNFEHML